MNTDLRKIREGRGHSLRQVAEAVGTSKQTIYHIEVCGQVPRLPLARKVADWYGVPLLAILTNGQADE